MAHKELVKYVKKQRKKGVSDINIEVKLKQHGWQSKHIDDAFESTKNKRHLLRRFLFTIIFTLIIFLVVVGFFRIKFYGSVLPESSDISEYEAEPKLDSFDYLLYGKHGEINFTLYKGLNDYFASLNRDIPFFGKQPTEKDVVMRFISSKKQANALRPFVEDIRKASDDDNARARVAISLVQLIPYDKGADEDGHIRYPYEVLYAHTAVCSEKSKLLIYLLQELGFGTAIIKYYEERHDAVGIQCPVEYSFQQSGYCFVETTSLSMITDSEGYYVGRGELTSTAEIIPISHGKSITDVGEDYNDLQEIKGIIQQGNGSLDDNTRLNELLRKYGFKD